MAKIRTIKREVFDEKLLHRFVLETYYETYEGARAGSLLPAHMKKEKINFVVPERQSKGGTYRADFEIFFRAKAGCEAPSEGVLVEIKWRAQDFKAENQVGEIFKSGGFCASLTPNKPELTGLPGLPPEGNISHVSIDEGEFRRWLSENVTRLLRDHLAAKSEGVAGLTSPAYWLIFVRGTKGQKNFNDMRREYKRMFQHPFWAFENNRRVLRQQFLIKPGDKLLFVFGSVPGSGQSLPGDLALLKKRQLLAATWFEGTVVEPYFMVRSEDEEVGWFLEEDRMPKPLGARKYTHFLSFTLPPKFLGKRGIERVSTSLPSLGEYAVLFRDSELAGNGGPVQIREDQRDLLINRLKANVPERS